MSRTEYHSGVARKAEFEEGTSLENKVKLLEESGYEFEWVDIPLNDIWCKELIFIPKTEDFYILEHHLEADPDQDLFVAEKNQDGSINFTLQFYNGGCGFEEAFETALRRMG